jgi:hypothetical protein
MCMVNHDDNDMWQCRLGSNNPITEEYNSYTSSIDLRVCSTFISIPITEEYNSSTNDQS